MLVATLYEFNANIMNIKESIAVKMREINLFLFLCEALKGLLVFSAGAKAMIGMIRIISVMIAGILQYKSGKNFTAKTVSMYIVVVIT